MNLQMDFIVLRYLADRFRHLGEQSSVISGCTYLRDGANRPWRNFLAKEFFFLIACMIVAVMHAVHCPFFFCLW